MEPVVDIIEEGKPTVTYGNMTAEKARRVVAEHIVNGRVVNDYVVASR
jgi:NADP-reducing hydrogenase subunit HndB